MIEKPILLVVACALVDTDRRVLIAHSAKLEGYKQMPDGLVRVMGLKLK